MAARLQHHLAYGAVGRAARSLAPTPPAELNEDTIRKLHALHPVEEKPTAPLQMPDALQIDEETLAKVCRAAPRGSAAGPSGTT